MNSVSGTNYLQNVTTLASVWLRSLTWLRRRRGIDSRGAPPFISSTLAAEQETGTAGVSDSDRASGTTWVLVREWLYCRIKQQVFVSNVIWVFSGKVDGVTLSSHGFSTSSDFRMALKMCIKYCYCTWAVYICIVWAHSHNSFLIKTTNKLARVLRWVSDAITFDFTWLTVLVTHFYCVAILAAEFWTITVMV